MLVEHLPYSPMDVHPGLQRTHTAPTAVPVGGINARSSPLYQTQSHSGSQHVSLPHNHSLNGLAVANGYPKGNLSNLTSVSTVGPVTASDNIINQRADASKSLFQICLSLRKRLALVPGLEYYVEEIDRMSSDPNTDIVDALWSWLKKGTPLITLYNALRPAEPLEVKKNLKTDKQIAQDAAYRFTTACRQQLGIPSDECFQIRDLSGDDTAGFVKVTQLVGKVLDILAQRNLLYDDQSEDNRGDSLAKPGEKPKQTRRDHIISELITTERKYVQDLEALQQFKRLVEEKQIVTGDTIHDIFLNLDKLLDFQRRFLIRIETLNMRPLNEQNWGQLFVQCQDAFQVYSAYIANQKKCEETAMREFDRLATVGSGVTADKTTLSAFLLKPFQRLAKYPLILKDLSKQESGEREKRDLIHGLEVATSILDKTNEAAAQEARDAAVEELKEHVGQWKNYNIDKWGELLLFGDFTILKQDGRAEVEKEVRIRLSPYVTDSMLDPANDDYINIKKAVKEGTLNVQFKLDPAPKTKRRDNYSSSPPTLSTSGKVGSLSKRTLFLPPFPFEFAGLKDISLPPTPLEVDNFQDSFLEEARQVLRPALKSSFDRSSCPSLVYELESPDTCSFTSSRRPSLETTTLILTTTNTSRPTSATMKLPPPGRWNFKKSPKDLDEDRSEAEFPSGTSFLECQFNSNLFAETFVKKRLANCEAFKSPQWEQYKVYLFYHILICVKDQTQRPKTKPKEKTDKKKQSKLALKGRIYMSNVTDVLYLSNPGERSYVIQIFWTADSGIENFMIRFPSEEVMRKWYRVLDRQQKLIRQDYDESSRTYASTSSNDYDFHWSKQNELPKGGHYQEDADDEDSEATVRGGYSEFNISRNGSSTSLRSRSTTMEGGAPQSKTPRYVQQYPQPALSLHTQVPSNPNNVLSPSDRAGQSFFSPGAETPMTARTSAGLSNFPFPHQPMVGTNGRPEEHNRYTAPAGPRSESRDGQHPYGHYGNGRAGQRPHNGQTPQQAAGNQRSRSVSSPSPGAAQGQNQPPVPDVPLPPFPPHLVRAAPNRSENNSPTNPPIILPNRSVTQSPGIQRERMHHHDQSYSRSQNSTPINGYHRQVHPNGAIPHMPNGTLHMPGGHSHMPAGATHMPVHEPPSPTQLKVKVSFDQHQVSLVVGLNINYQILADRIDAKIKRIQELSIASGSLRLLYKDEDDDLVLIQSDEDIHNAFTDWKDQQKSSLNRGSMEEIQFLCQRVVAEPPS